MLVNTHKLIVSLLLLSTWGFVKAEDVWTLQQCLDSALVHNRNLQINRNVISLSQEREKEAKAGLYPRISANADYKYFIDLPYQLMPASALNPLAPEGQFKELQFGVPHNMNANVQLTMTLYNPQLYGAIHSAQIAGELSGLQYRKAEEQVLFDVTTLYYNAQILRSQLDFTESNLVNTHKLLKNMQLLQEQLMAKGTDVNKVKLQADQLITYKEMLRNKYELALNGLKLNVGIDLARKIEVEAGIHIQSGADYAVHPSVDLQIIQTQQKLLNSELKTLHQSRYLPSLNLMTSYGSTGFGYDKSPNRFLKFFPTGFAGLQLAYPLFNGTVTRRKINQKQWEINNNELQAGLIADQYKMEIENAGRQRTTALQAVVNTEHQIQQAKIIYTQTLLQQKEGTANLVDVLLSDNALRETQQNYLSAVVEYLKADLALKKLSGNFKVVQ